MTTDPTRVGRGRGRRARLSSRSLGLASAYRARLVDAIRIGYPKLAAAIGEEAFDAAVQSYLARYPSTRLSVRGAGAQLPEFLIGSAEHQLWQGELALLDRAYTTLADTDEVDVLTAAMFVPDQMIRLAPHVLVELTTSVDELWEAIHVHDLPAFPRALDWPRTVVIWRGKTGSHQRVVAADEVAAMHAAAAGVTLGELSAKLAASTNPMARAVDIVLAWIDEHLVARAS